MGNTLKSRNDTTRLSADSTASTQEIDLNVDGVLAQPGEHASGLPEVNPVLRELLKAAGRTEEDEEKLIV